MEVTGDLKIFVAGHNGMLGSAIVRQLHQAGFTNILTASRAELDLKDQNAVHRYFQNYSPDCVILAAAKVGGIRANIKFPVEFLLDNLIIQTNVISSAFVTGVKKFVFLGSSCIYPRDCTQPLKEEYLLTGALEPTNEGYALAKITGLKLLEYYNRQYNWNVISLMPCNLYGPNDNFDPEHSHVLSALVKKFVDAVKKGNDCIEMWGTGIARREFMHVDDAAKAVVYFLQYYNDSSFVNIGWGSDISIKELAEMIAYKTGFTGDINWNCKYPDGMLKKCLDITKMKHLGFEPSISLDSGIEQMIQIYKNQNSI